MEEEEKGIQDYGAVLKRNKNQVWLIMIIIFIIMIAIALKWPATYKSTATILIEQQEIPQDLVRSTVTSYADQRIQVISQRVMSSVNLKKIIEKFGLFKDEKKIETTATILDDMREDIVLEMISADVVDPRSGRPTEATIAFSLSFQNESAKITQQVANELVNLYLNENLKRRSEIASEATDFLSFEAKKLSTLIDELEAELAVFKEKNASSLPELQQLNMNLMDRTEQQLVTTEQQITSLSDRIVYLKAELSQIEPNMSIFSATGQRIYGSQDRLKSLQAEYIGLKARYASNHPDVMKMQKEINALEKEVGGVDKQEIQTQIKSKRAELALLSDRYSSEHPDVKKLRKELSNLENGLAAPPAKPKKSRTKPDNPAYIQLQAQLEAARAELGAMYTARNKQLDKLEKYEAGLLKAPQVERQYQDLTREYDNALLKFREVKAKQMEADMAQAMEKGRKAERFTLIEPPMFPEEPFKPNRKVIILFGLILSIGGALSFVLIKNSLNPRIYGANGLMAVTGAMPLVVIPYLENAADISQAKKVKIQIIFSSVSAIVVLILSLHFFIKPLDVIWYIALRKLGIG